MVLSERQIKYCLLSPTAFVFLSMSAILSSCPAATPSATTNLTFTVDSMGTASSIVLNAGPSSAPQFTNGSAEYRIVIDNGAPIINANVVNLALVAGQTVSITATANASGGSDYSLANGGATLTVADNGGTLPTFSVTSMSSAAANATSSEIAFSQALSYFSDSAPSSFFAAFGSDGAGHSKVRRPTIPGGVEDADFDGLPDSYEFFHFGSLDGNTFDDSDNDGLDNLSEFNLGTSPSIADTDGDGLDDGEEINTHGTDPLDSDIDGDGIRDGAETNTGIFVDQNNTGTDPLQLDTDGDGFPDFEINFGTDPLTRTFSGV